LRLQSKMGGRLHLRLNIGRRPIENKYSEGKMKSTLKREFKEREIAKSETFGTIVAYVCGIYFLQIEQVSRS